MTYNVLEKIIHFSYTIINHIPFAKKILSFFGIKYVIGFGRKKGIIQEIDHYKDSYWNEVVASIVEGLADLLGPLVEAARHLVEVPGHIVRRAEVRYKEPSRLPGAQQVEACMPDFEVDVWRRRHRDDIVRAQNTHPRRIACKGGAGGPIQVADVMDGVPRRIGHLESAPADL